MSTALNDLDHLHCLLKMNCDSTIDEEFSVEENEAALRKLKLRKTCGINNLQSEHLKLGGSLLIVWLKQIFNAFSQFECFISDTHWYYQTHLQGQRKRTTLL